MTTYPSSIATMSLGTAGQLLDGVFGYAAEQGLKPLTAVVLDSGGHVVASARQDGASAKRFEIAHGKAHGAIALGIGSRALMTRAESQAYFITAVAEVTGPLIPVPGGVLLFATTGSSTGEQLIGAIGVTGDTSDADEAAAVHAANLVGLRASTG